ncbi:hypothetical protein JRQ81_005252, partial [Phrynocephalus forsythii]
APGALRPPPPGYSAMRIFFGLCLFLLLILPEDAEMGCADEDGATGKKPTWDAALVTGQSSSVVFGFAKKLQIKEPMNAEECTKVTAHCGFLVCITPDVPWGRCSFGRPCCIRHIDLPMCSILEWYPLLQTRSRPELVSVVVMVEPLSVTLQQKLSSENPQTQDPVLVSVARNQYSTGVLQQLLPFRNQLLFLVGGFHFMETFFRVDTCNSFPVYQTAVLPVMSPENMTIQ